MTEAQVLYDAVLDDPSDDGPRLALADLFDLHGRPTYAAFIRSSFRRESMECACSDVKRTPTVWQESRRGIMTPRRPWYGHDRDCPLAACGLIDLMAEAQVASDCLIRVSDELTGRAFRFGAWRGPVAAGWRRGFCAEVCCEADDWHQYGPAAVTIHPIERVTFHDHWPLRCEAGDCAYLCGDEGVNANHFHPHILRREMFADELARPDPASELRGVPPASAELLRRASGGSPFRWIYFRDARRAEEAASRCAIRYARRLALLPIRVPRPRADGVVE